MYKFTVTKLIIDPLYLLNSKLSQLNFNGSRMVTLSMRMLDQFLHLDRLLHQCRLGHTKVFLC